MKGIIGLWSMLAVLVLGGCASNPGRASGDSPAAAANTTAEGEMASPGASGTDDEASTSRAYYSADQAERGEGFFRETCLSCHSSGDFNGSTFQRQWSGRTVRDLYTTIAYSMPDDNPGGLPAQTYVDVIAYILRLNHFPDGAAELTTDREAMRSMPLWPEEPARR